MRWTEKLEGIGVTENRLILTLFGATGDLAARKLYPALYRLYKNGHISTHFALVGTGRTEWTHQEMRQRVSESVKQEVDDAKHLEEFLSHVYYVSHDVNDTTHYQRLKKFQEELDEKYDTKGNRIFYISLSPTLFPTITGHLRDQQLITDDGYNRLIIEKPFGHDTASAQELQQSLNNAFDENQIFRIDHYLGKEMVQAIRNIRFDNRVFADSWNNQGIDNIQISLLEEVGVEDRGEYYDTSGATRDMIQNHALQILALLAMNQPKEATAEAIQEEKIQVLASLYYPQDAKEVSEKFVRGQYGPSKELKGYRQEDKVSETSDTETYFAACVEIDLPQWQGVPFFIRTGKRLNSKATTIDVQFKPTQEGVPGNQLHIEVAPRTGYRFTVNQKKLGYSHETESIPLEYYYTPEQLAETPQDYERLIYECILGDKSHFAHYLEVEHAWKYIDHLFSYWNQEKPEFPNYEAGSRGPDAAEALLAQYHTNWQE
ncbi:glucose-6-phosphate dehydrogenase [Aerococcaceae bacterium zg-BR9]|nr:glucose-6-phosphate dehydrogenase [Aerococcaceae bacterium zg-BR9]MBF6626246.1 glucose-6-phosphate dehydrogenase [Aerococcaceae bacterium zg-BR9]